ncbi:MAG: glutathione transferase GstA [Gammaproteobacteria bacterium]|nr:glutathione transferase GstA [Gammaproteobacteria bacterium]
MKLYYSPGVCSLSPHICLREAGMAVDLVKVDIKAHTLDGGGDYLKINPNGYVPVLELDNGERLTEGPAIVQYIADQKPASRLAPPSGTVERAHLQSLLNYLSTEIHKGYSPLFNPAANDEFKVWLKQRLSDRYTWLAEQLGNKQYLMGEQFTAADAYLFTTIGWMGFVGLDVGTWPILSAYRDRIAARPRVQEAMRAEGLIK